MANRFSDQEEGAEEGEVDIGEEGEVRVRRWIPE